jgi:membrane-bound ClpP family serine protease
MGSRETIVKYVLLQLPALVLVILAVVLARRWVDYPVWLAWAIPIVWAAKDAILYPFLWKAYESKDGSDSTSLVGSFGTARNRLDPDGFVYVRGERWRAVATSGSTPVEKGKTVRVTAMKGLTLEVEACEERVKEEGKGEAAVSGKDLAQ